MSNFEHSLLILNQSDDDETPDRDRGVVVAPIKPALKKPSMYKVVMLNDDFTPMDFVVEVLTRYFAMNLEKATQVMLAVHTQGKAVCGMFTRDVAETKVMQVNEYSAECEHPLLCEIERVD